MGADWVSTEPAWAGLGATAVAIPGGIWGRETGDASTERALRRDLLLRPVAGDDEAYLFGTAVGPQVERASRLLDRCLVGDPSAEPVAVDMLTVGDREALLLQLRRLSVGDRLDSVVDCPAPECGERMELELEVADLLVPAYQDVAPDYRVLIEHADGPLDVRFRVPTVADLAALAADPGLDPEAGALRLLERCVLAVSRAGAPLAISELDDAARAGISTAIADRDPQAEIELELACPTCGLEFAVILDAGTFLLQELDARGEQLLEDVHALALHYHWSEHDILALPASRRERYLDLLAASLRVGAAAGAEP